MKLHRLELAGFGPFLDRQDVDFDAFDGDGLFLIAGRTGAGKSSILDAVCFALYGTAPRYDGGDRALRSDHCEPHDPTEVALEFTAGGARWRITRTPEYLRPSKRAGSPPVEAKSTVLLEEWVGGEWVARSSKQRETGELIRDEIVRLDRDQFQQVILLAQNRFAEFLLARNDDRQALLRTLFGTRTYEDYQQAFDRRRKDAERDLAAQAAQLDAALAEAERLIADADLADPDEVPGAAPDLRLDAIRRAEPRAHYRADESARRQAEAQAAHDDALTAYAAHKETRDRQLERLASRAALARLDARIPEVDRDRARLRAASEAEVLRAAVSAAHTARETAEKARVAATDAERAWVAAGGREPTTAEMLRAVADELAGDLALWTAAAAQEDGLTALRREHGLLSVEIGAAEARLGELDASLTRHPARLAEISARLEALGSVGEGATHAQAAVIAAEDRLAAGRRAEELAIALQSAERDLLSASTAREEAVAVVGTLLRRRLEGYAGELAANLVAGEPCEVCGAIEHPHPAEPGGAPVTDDAIAAAESAAARASETLATAIAHERHARSAHQDASARAAGEPVIVLEGVLAAAVAAADAAERASAEHADLTAERADIDALLAAQTAERARVADDLAAARERLAASEQRIADAVAVVDLARGDAPSVTARIADGTRRRDLARRLAAALDDAAQRDQTATAAERERDAVIAESGFADVAGVEAALLDGPARDALDAGIRAFDADRTAERHRLRDLELALAGLADDPVDLAPVEAAVNAARDASRAAIAAATRAEQIASALRDAARRAADLHAGSEAQVAAFAVLAGLSAAISGRTERRMDLETFVLAAELERIVDAANLRLEAMSEGRYRLVHTDAVGARKVASGLGIEVFDAFTGHARPPQSLSGGETFLASLALALGLAEVVTSDAGGVRLDTLFIDEGFGSLDADTLEIAMRTLDELRQGGRTVGLISHVESMRDELPAQLTVERTRQGPSVIRQQVLAAL